MVGWTLLTFSIDNHALSCHRPFLGQGRWLLHLFLWCWRRLLLLWQVWCGRISIFLGWSPLGPYVLGSVCDPSVGSRALWWVFYSPCLVGLLVYSCWFLFGLSFCRLGTSIPGRSWSLRQRHVVVCQCILLLGFVWCRKSVCSVVLPRCVIPQWLSTIHMGIHPYQSQSHFLRGVVPFLLALSLFSHSTLFLLDLLGPGSGGFCWGCVWGKASTLLTLFPFLVVFYCRPVVLHSCLLDTFYFRK